MKASKLFLIGAAIGVAILAASSSHAAAPGKPTSVSPGGKVAGSTVTFSWAPVSGATKYQLQVKCGAAVKLNRTFTASQATCSGGNGTCSAEATIGNGASPLTWTLRAGNADGFGAWSEEKNLTMTDEMRWPISKLPYTISNPGSFYITGNLTSTGNGIIVNADNVTIDLNGYTLTGPGDGDNDGVYMNGRKNVEIRNGTIESFGRHGVWEAGLLGFGHRVIGVRAIGNGSVGLYVQGKRNLIENCGVFDNSWNGISVGSNSVVKGCVSAGNDTGIIVNSGSVVSDNDCSGNDGVGIFALYGNTITGNTARDNATHGISADKYNTLKNNTATDNQDSGIYLIGGHNLLDGNTAYHNNLSGATYPNISDCATCQWGLNVQ